MGRVLGFGVWGLGFGVWVLGFGVWGLEFGVWGLGRNQALYTVVHPHMGFLWSRGASLNGCLQGLRAQVTSEFRGGRGTGQRAHRLGRRRQDVCCGVGVWEGCRGGFVQCSDLQGFGGLLGCKWMWQLQLSDVLGWHYECMILKAQWKTVPNAGKNHPPTVHR